MAILLTVTGPNCGVVTDRSGFGFDGSAPPTELVNFGVPFLLGQFTHYNNPNSS